MVTIPVSSETFRDTGNKLRISRKEKKEKHLIRHWIEHCEWKETRKAKKKHNLSKETWSDTMWRFPVKTWTSTEWNVKETRKNRHWSSNTNENLLLKNTALSETLQRFHIYLQSLLLGIGMRQTVVRDLKEKIQTSKENKIFLNWVTKSPKQTLDRPVMQCGSDDLQGKTVSALKPSRKNNYRKKNSSYFWKAVPTSKSLTLKQHSKGLWNNLMFEDYKSAGKLARSEITREPLIRSAEGLWNSEKS